MHFLLLPRIGIPNGLTLLGIVFSFTSLSLCSMNVTCLLGCYSHALWDSKAQVLPIVPAEAMDILSQAMQDGRDAAKFTICHGLDTMDSLGRDIATSVALRRRVDAVHWFF